MTLWFHLACGAYKRPEALLEALAATGEVAERAWLEAQARAGLEHRRLPRADGAERAPSGRATCRNCRAKIDSGTWRIRLVFFQDGRFAPSGFIHAGCAVAYLGTADLLPRLEHFGGELAGRERASLVEALAEPGDGAPPGAGAPQGD